jgi:hypothetical protein
MWQSTGKEQAQATVTIRDGSIKVEANHLGESVLHVIADAETWLAFLAKEKNLLWALLTRKIRLRGNPQWLLRFSGCFLGWGGAGPRALTVHVIFAGGESGEELSLVQRLMGHSSLLTTALYLHVTACRLGEVRSPLDLIDTSHVQP